MKVRPIFIAGPRGNDEVSAKNRDAGSSLRRSDTKNKKKGMNDETNCNTAGKKFWRVIKLPQPCPRPSDEENIVVQPANRERITRLPYVVSEAAYEKKLRYHGYGTNHSFSRYSLQYEKIQG